jgi:hypothetical protein
MVAIMWPSLRSEYRLRRSLEVGTMEDLLETVRCFLWDTRVLSASIYLRNIGCTLSMPFV